MKTIALVLAGGTLLAGCSYESQEPSSPALEALPVSQTVSEMPKPIPAPESFPVDEATARSSWKDGVTLFENGDYRGAAERLRVAARGRKDDASCRYLLGLALWKSGDAAGAEGALVESVTLDPGRLTGWINLARVRHDLDDRKGALRAADKALEIDPTSADALHQRGRALMEQKRGPEALDALKTAHDLDPDDGYIANTYGLLLILTGKPGDAIAPLEAARTALPHVAYVRNNLGVAYERTGRTGEAKLEYQAAVDAGDTGGRAMRSLVRLGATDTTSTTDVALSAKSE